MGLVVTIYKDGERPPTRGVSAHVDKLTLVNVDGPFEPSAEAPPAFLEKGNIPGVAKVVPHGGAPGMPGMGAGLAGYVGPMFNGSYVGTSDSRFREAVEEITGAPFAGAVQLHDRYETPAEYEALSR